MTIAIGNVVTVNNDETSYFEKTGLVVEISDDGDEDGPIGVRFHRDDMLYFARHDSECVVRFKESELRIEEGWPLEYLAKQLFGDHYHSLLWFPYKFSSENDCEHVDCGNKNTVRILTNSWGSVCEHDVCDTHAEMHGMCVDVFPNKKDYQPNVEIPRKEVSS